MAVYFGKLAGKVAYFALTFFTLYFLSFYYALRIVDTFGIDESMHSIRILAYGTMIASILSFTGTIFLHVLYRYIGKANNFAPWFRTVNLIFLYASGLITAIAAMKGLLLTNNFIKGNESIFDDRFSLMAVIFFIGVFNYTLYNAVVLSKPREIPVIEWFSELRDHWRRQL
ncbi:hypothetical protein F4V43_08405 [Paenibacillus spiritus]|uniref:Uncharacterized protein n=1 Tax=Paenibacillus spiritus TaxID=2496557 RepID=A0A5J5GBZ1_9BACL|nr:hypothetical protein [Paenibacillus spiritus]KAA9005480.1 hypothetical protein F4V43_08405 [Paenibacillus spiritus]